MHARTALLVALLAIAPAGAAQTPTLSETYEVVVHNLDVFVTDAKGNPVAGLSKDDFEVLVDNRRQEITHFAAYQQRADKPSTPEEAPKKDVPGTTEPPRTIVFFIDEVALHPTTRAKFHEQVETLARQILRPNDQAMIVTPAAKEKVALPLTDDHQVALEEIGKVLAAQSPLNRAVQRERVDLERDLDRATTPEEVEFAYFAYSSAVSARVKQRLAVLHSVLAGLAGIDGRKAVVLVTESLSAEPDADRPPSPTTNSRRVSTDLRPLIRDVARAAASANVTIYALQPEYSLASAASGSVEKRAGATRERDLDYLHRSMTNTQVSLQILSEMTGGTWNRGDGGLRTGFRQLTDDLVSYYSLGYRQRAGEPDKPQNLRVRVKGRPELTVRSRGEAVRKSPTRQMNDLVMAGFLTPAPNDLEIAMIVGTPVQDAKKTWTVPVDVRIPLEKLTFLRERDRYVARFSVHFAAMGELTEFVSGEPRELSLELTPAQHAEIAGKQYGHNTDLRIAAGTLHIAVGVRDILGGTTGVVSQTIDLE